jgi:hypothetical protein
MRIPQMSDLWTFEIAPFRHSGEALSTAPHSPKLRHIGQTLNARGFANATCWALQPLVYRRRKGAHGASFFLAFN